MQSTEELVESARAGSNDSLRRLIERYEHAAVVTAWKVVGDFHLAQDVAQESLVEAVRHLSQLREAGSFGPWLLSCVRRRANRARVRRPREVYGLELAEIAPGDQADDLWLRDFDDILPMLTALSEHEADVVNLRYISGFSMRQIAEELGRPVGTVTKQLSRAVRRLQSMFAEVES